MRNSFVCLTSVILSLCGLAKADLNDGLVAYYPFNGNANDESGNGNDGTVNGATLTLDRNGVADSAFDFDGDDFIKALDSETLRSGSITLSCWVYSENNNRDVVVISKITDVSPAQVGDPNQPASHSYRIRLNGELPFWEINTNNPWTQLSGSEISRGQWELLTVTWDGQAQKIYRNGQLDSVNDNAADGNIKHLPGADLMIGRGWNPDGNFFDGQIDDVRIYNRALNEQEVSELYDLEKPKPSLDDGLVAYYPFNGNANDESGNGNDALVIGAALTADRNGVAGSAFDFDGNDSVETPVTLSPYNRGSFSAWVRTSINTAPASTRSVVSQARLPGGTGFTLTVDVGGRPSADYLERAGNGDISVAASQNGVDISNDRWYHLVATTDGERTRLYSSGMLIATSTRYGSSDPATSQNILIGRELPNGIGRFFLGLIDDVRIYNRALSGEEVTALYNLEKANPAPPLVQLGALYESPSGEAIVIDATPTAGFPAEFTYQWCFDGFKIPANLGGTASSINIDSLQANEGTWSVTVTNETGSVEQSFEYRVYVDSDLDGLSDAYEELVSLTNINNSDTDNDGLADGDEVNTYSTNPNSSDSDSDGFTDLYELETAYDPNSAESTPDAQVNIMTAIEVDFNAALGATYEIQFSTDTIEWTVIEAGIVGEGNAVERLYSRKDFPTGFFRVERTDQ